MIGTCEEEGLVKVIGGLEEEADVEVVGVLAEVVFGSTFFCLFFLDFFFFLYVTTINGVTSSSLSGIRDVSIVDWCIDESKISISELCEQLLSAVISI